MRPQSRTRGLSAAIVLNCFIVLLYAILPALPYDAKIWLAQHFWSLGLLMPHMAAMLVATGLSAALDVETRWLQIVVAWAVTLPVSYIYIRVVSVLWRAIRYRKAMPERRS